jgi:prepilin-type N-terminal cleavage/methylation domain-containing protein
MKGDEMNNDRGFSLIELLVTVAIIAVVAAIAIPNLVTSRQAANEAGAIKACRTLGSAEIAFMGVNNQQYTTIQTLVANEYLDSRFSSTAGFHGYSYAPGTVANAAGGGSPPTGFEFVATPTTGGGRFTYGIASDQVIRYLGATSGTPAPVGLAVGDPIGKQ